MTLKDAISLAKVPKGASRSAGRVTAILPARSREIQRAYGCVGHLYLYRFTRWIKETGFAHVFTHYKDETKVQFVPSRLRVDELPKIYILISYALGGENFVYLGNYWPKTGKVKYEHRRDSGKDWNTLPEITRFNLKIPKK